MIWFYGRVSTDHQENSAANQRQMAEKLQDEYGEDVRIVIDEDVSGSTSLKDRERGREVWDALQKGDTLIVSKLDRGWRSVEDAAHSLRVLREIGVRLRILDSPIDVSTDEGEMMFLMFASFAQYENKVRGRRVSDVFQYRKRNGLPYSVTRPFGWCRKGDQWVELPAERDIADKAAKLRASGMSFNAIANTLCLQKGCSKPVFRAQTIHGKKAKASWYSGKELKGLLLAREAGYPTIPQAHVPKLLTSEKSA